MEILLYVTKWHIIKCQQDYTVLFLCLKWDIINEVELAFLIFLRLFPVCILIWDLYLATLCNKAKKVYILYKQLFDHILRSTQTFLEFKIDIPAAAFFSQKISSFNRLISHIFAAAVVDLKGVVIQPASLWCVVALHRFMCR